MEIALSISLFANVVIVAFLVWVLYSRRSVVDVADARKAVQHTKRVNAADPKDPPNDTTADDAAAILSGKRRKQLDSTVMMLVFALVFVTPLSSYATEPGWRPTAWACDVAMKGDKDKIKFERFVCLTPKDAVRVEEQLQKLDRTVPTLELCDRKLHECGAIKEPTIPKWMAYAAAVLAAGLIVVPTVKSITD